ncbi:MULTISPECIES: chemotaxis protein CheW [Sphaerotilus]|jgi:purine-binding chemotaxis protein CheW|uniref:Purine-binding chemotaxis protein CheW n=1 Tax=Sphaerotilus uruguayifluvii TaxID=2735897 RepID=A0ABX2GA94_9BURK|nr:MULTISPECIES: chemotaxis protein CheW [Sphaerotilaceae]NRT58527.1 purine-binding chemotaxis protein CheW [Leptothrix sp. C29]GKQ58125.1 chemotaxis protein CheW [Sphaerotilus sp. FB-3]
MIASSIASASRGHGQPAREDDGSPLHQFLCFALGLEPCAVRIDLVREILEVGHMTPLPLMPAFVRGVMNLRGVVVPVIDLGARLGLPATVIGRRTCIVIVDVCLPDDGGTQTLGVLVDAVQEVINIAERDLEPVPRLGTRIDAAHLRSMVRHRQQATPELDLAAILDPQRLVGLIGEHRQHAQPPH